MADAVIVALALCVGGPALAGVACWLLYAVCAVADALAEMIFKRRWLG